MEAARRRGRPRDESIDAAIYAATVDELTERGFLALSMESIAARAGVAKTTLYRRWPASEGLCVAAIRSLDSEDVPPPPGDSARDDLLFLLERMRRTWSNPRFAALMRRVAADGTVQPEVYAQVRDKVRAPHVAAMTAALRRAVEDGLIRPDADLDAVRVLLVSPILANTMTPKARLSAGRLEFFLDTVLRGLAP